MIPLTHGLSLRQLSTTEFRLVETRHARGLHVSPHQHERACINFVLEGGYAERTTDGRGLYGPMWNLYKPAGESHENDFKDAGARCLLIEAHTESPGGALSTHHPHQTRDPQLAVLALRLWYELAVPDELTPMTVDELAHRLYSRAIDAPREPSAHERLRRVTALLQDGPDEPWTLSRLAAEVDLHPSHLARAFRRRHGRTIGEFLRELRVGRVARALALGRRPIAELSSEAGFADQSHCTRSFRRLLGTTPAAFRRALGS